MGCTRISGYGFRVFVEGKEIFRREESPHLIEKGMRILVAGVVHFDIIDEVTYFCPFCRDYYFLPHKQSGCPKCHKQGDKLYE